jgi:hypothetical protein
MSASRLINQGHQSLICKGEWVPDYNWDLPEQLNIPIYGDTDNLIFQARQVEKIHDVMKRDGLLPNPVLCSFNEDGMFFKFSLEFEAWHKCKNLPAPDAPLVSHGIFLGKKSYVMECVFCGEVRLKAKGHNQSGLLPKDMCVLFAPSNEENMLLPRGESTSAKATTIRLFQAVYPNLSTGEITKLTSGARFSFAISLPKSGKIGIVPTFIERTYCAFIPAPSCRCRICLRIIHK